jgi:hypothetical protein
MKFENYLNEQKAAFIIDNGKPLEVKNAKTGKVLMMLSRYAV